MEGGSHQGAHWVTWSHNYVIKIKINYENSVNKRQSDKKTSKCRSQQKEPNETRARGGLPELQKLGKKKAGSWLAAMG